MTKGTVSGIAGADRMMSWRTYGSGLCLQAVDRALQKPLSDRPGFYTYALRALETVPAANRHYDRTPPKGAIVFFSAGRNGYGHICISVGGGNVVSTDIPSSGRVGVTSISAIEKAWGRKFLCWTNWVMGYNVTTATPAAPAPAGGASGSYPARKLYGGGWVTFVQDLLTILGHDTGGRDGKDGTKTQAAVKHEQGAAKSNGYGTLTQDGIAGPASLTYLLWAVQKFRTKGEKTAGQPARTRYGQAWVKLIQRMLVELGHTLTVDGADGAKTQAAVRHEQGAAKSNGYGTLTQDGIAGFATAKYLVWAIAKYRLPWT